MSYVLGDYIEPPPENQLLPGSVTGDLSFAWNHATDFEARLLKSMQRLIRGNHRWVEVKIRCALVKGGDPFMPMSKPHYDTTMDLHREELPEVHHLYCTPPAPIFFTVSEQLTVLETRPPQGCVLTYGRHSLHQTPLMEQDTLRLLLRISETDIIKPRNRVEGRSKWPRLG